MTQNPPERIRLSVSGAFHNKENRAQPRNGSNKYAYTEFTTVAWSIKQVVEHVTSGRAIAVAALKEKRRISGNFESAQVMGVDFDDGTVGVDELLEDTIVYEHAFLVYPTPSHTPEAPRARALFCLDEPLTDPDTYRLLLKRLMHHFGARIDESCKDPVRLFYGSDKPGFSAITSAVLPVKVLENLPKHPDETRGQAVSTEPIRVHVNGSGNKDRYVERSVERIVDTLVNTRYHRNEALNKAAFSMGRLVAASWANLDRLTAENVLLSAATANGYVSKDGESDARATIRSGLESGMRDPRPLPADRPLTRQQSAAPQPSPAANSNYSEPPAPASITWKTSDDSMARYRERLRKPREGGVLPLIFPFKALHPFGGMAHVIDGGYMVGVVGMSGGMKTSFAETITDAWKQMDVNDVLWWGSEWTWDKMADRAVQRWGGVSATDMLLHEMWLGEKAAGISPAQRHGKELTEREIEASDKVTRQIEAWAGKNHYIEQPISDIDQLLTAFGERIAEQAAAGRSIRISVFDYVQLLDIYSARSESERVTSILAKIKEFCTAHHQIGVVATQVTKTSAGNAKTGAGVLEAESAQFVRSDKFNLVLTLNPVYDNGLLTNQGVINVAKNSLGKTGRQTVFIDPSRFKWIDSIVPEQQVRSIDEVTEEYLREIPF